jgi:hypothetical protein|nr:MAG TPA: hypothetical protein [Caudoviricetes sp.]
MTIFKDTKTYLGLMEDDDSFDSEVKDAIDNALATATQLNHEVSAIPSSEADYPATTLGRILRQYVNYSVRLTFDPPQTSFAIKAIEAMKQEAEWRLTIQ